MRIVILLAAFVLLLTSAGNRYASGHANAADSTPPQMKQYWLVLLRKGANRSQDSTAAEKIQAAHMRNIQSMAARGALIMAGPIGKEDDLRGIFIIDAPDSASVVAMVQKDSAVVTGRLRMDIYPWWAQKGTYHLR